MAILVDPPAVPAYGTLWSHLISDTSLEELHDFARRHGLPRRGFEGDHYDIPQQAYDALLAAGARPVSSREVVTALRRSGLRLQKRKGDKPVDRVKDLALPSGEVTDVDLIASPRPVPDSRALGASVLMRDRDGLFAVVFSERRQQWGPPGGWLEDGESVLDAAAREVWEETGVQIRTEAILPVGFEHFHPHDQQAWRLGRAAGRDLLAVLETRLDAQAPPLHAVENETSGQAWVDSSEFERRCGREFWWPLAAYRYEIGLWARPRR